MSARVKLVAIVAALASAEAGAQERFSFFYATTPQVAELMLTLAELRDNDVVMDLGSGDGVIPLTAARMNARVRGRGLDLDAKLVDQANARARAEKVADRVQFEHRNAFDVDLSDVTVVTMWLYPELMRLLRPVILERARPGTRVVTSTWDLGSWPPDRTQMDETTVHLWIVPARVAGGWHWELTVRGRPLRYAAELEQRFQMVEGAVRAGDRREVLQEMRLSGTQLSFGLAVTIDGLGLVRHEFNGTVSGDDVAGTVKVTLADESTETLVWRARRAAKSDYFAPTGTPAVVPAGP